MTSTSIETQKFISKIDGCPAREKRMYYDIIRNIYSYLTLGEIYSLRCVNQEFNRASFDAIDRSLMTTHTHISWAINKYHLLLREMGITRDQIISRINLDAPKDANIESTILMVNDCEIYIIGLQKNRYTHGYAQMLKHKPDGQITCNCICVASRGLYETFVINPSKGYYRTIRSSDPEYKELSQKIDARTCYLLGRHGMFVHADKGNIAIANHYDQIMDLKPATCPKSYDVKAVSSDDYIDICDTCDDGLDDDDEQVLVTVDSKEYVDWFD